VSLRRIDIRFVLPSLPARAVVFGLDDWESALRAAGVEVGATQRQPDLAVAPSERVAEAVASGAANVILEGRAGMRSLSHGGYASRAYLPLPAVAAPDLILPLGLDSPAGYALSRWRPAETLVKRARNAAAAQLARWGAIPGRTRQFLGTRETGPPLLIAAAAQHGVPQDASWFLTPGQGDDLTRGVFHLFPRARPEPAWVLKFARLHSRAGPPTGATSSSSRAAAYGSSVRTARNRDASPSDLCAGPSGHPTVPRSRTRLAAASGLSTRTERIDTALRMALATTTCLPGSHDRRP